MSTIVGQSESRAEAPAVDNTMPEAPDFPRKARHVILCCDCEGTEEQLRRLFEAIQQAEVAANFFFVGETAETYPELVREIADHHQAESHTYSHPNLRKLGYKKQREEILAGKAAVEQAIGRATRGFRAPMHHVDRNTVRILNEEGFTFDASRLYFRYHMGRVEELDPTWWREWMPIYERIGVSPRMAFRWFLTLTRWKRLCVLPAHPHYAGASKSMADAFRDFLIEARDEGVNFWYADDYLRVFRGVSLPEARAKNGLPAPLPPLANR